MERILDARSAAEEAQSTTAESRQKAEERLAARFAES
jgi:hypothetical protein